MVEFAGHLVAWVTNDVWWPSVDEKRILQQKWSHVPCEMESPKLPCCLVFRSVFRSVFRVKTSYRVQKDCRRGQHPKRSWRESNISKQLEDTRCYGLYCCVDFWWNHVPMWLISPNVESDLQTSSFRSSFHMFSGACVLTRQCCLHSLGTQRLNLEKYPYGMVRGIRLKVAALIGEMMINHEFLEHFLFSGKAIYVILGSSDLGLVKSTPGNRAKVSIKGDAWTHALLAEPVNPWFSKISRTTSFKQDNCWMLVLSRGWNSA